MNDELEVYVTLAEHAGEFRVLRLEGHEAISRMFRFDVDVVCMDGELPKAAAPGALATICFQKNGEVLRRVHGMLERVRRRLEDRPVFHLRLVPRAARGHLIKMQEIFLGQTVEEIIISKLDLVDAGPPDNSQGAGGPAGAEALPYGLDAQKSEPREFVVQYAETDTDFVCRLAEDAGLAFFFEHDEHGDHMRFAGTTAGLENRQQAPTVRLTRQLTEPNCAYSLDRTKRLVPGSYVVYDYNYRRAEEVIWPARPEEGAITSPGTIFEYGCHAKDADHAKAIHAVRADEVQCRKLRYRGASSVLAMAAGGRTRIEADDEEFDKAELLVTSVRHTVAPAEAAGPTKLVYRNTFRAVGVEHTYRPKRRTKKPRMSGVVTGVIQGPNGALDASGAYLDDKGRYLVKFHFDWAAIPGEQASRWVRMAQPFGGKTDGMHFPLRPGTEVILAFTDGDPDRPVILGAIPNITTKSPVTDQNATQNRIHTASGALFEISQRK